MPESTEWKVLAFYFKDSFFKEVIEEHCRIETQHDDGGVSDATKAVTITHLKGILREFRSVKKLIRDNGTIVSRMREIKEQRKQLEQ